MLLCSGSSPRGEGDGKIWRLKTRRPLTCQQPVLVVLAGASAVSQGVDNLELLDPHLVVEQLILMVLFHCRALPHR